MSKGSSEIATAALYVGITVAAISSATTVGIPALDNMQDAAAVSNAENMMQEIDNTVEDVIAEGEGSTRTVDLDIDRGRIHFDNTTQSLVYSLETDADIISPQTSTRNGNIVLSSNSGVRVIEDSFNGEECYLMENERTKACIKKIGSPDNFEDLDTSNLLIHYEFKDEEEEQELNGELKVELNEIEETSFGTGYTSPDETGDYIGTGEVTATVQSDHGFRYDIIFRLPTGADFIEIDIQNFR